MPDPEELLHPIVSGSLNQLHVEYDVMVCDPALADTAAFCDHYNFAPGETANSIITATKTNPIRFACCVVLANCKLDVNKKVCTLLEVKRCSFASAEQTLALTGMQIGGVTPFGLPEMPIFIDEAIVQNKRTVLGGGNRTSKILLNPAELKKLPNVTFVNGLGIMKG